MLLDALWKCIKDSPKQKVFQKKILKILVWYSALMPSSKNLIKLKLSAFKQRLTVHLFRVYETAAYASDVAVHPTLPIHLYQPGRKVR